MTEEEKNRARLVDALTGLANRWAWEDHEVNLSVATPPLFHDDPGKCMRKLTRR